MVPSGVTVPMNWVIFTTTNELYTPEAKNGFDPLDTFFMRRVHVLAVKKIQRRHDVNPPAVTPTAIRNVLLLAHFIQRVNMVCPGTIISFLLTAFGRFFESRTRSLICNEDHGTGMTYIEELASNCALNLVAGCSETGVAKVLTAFNSFNPALIGKGAVSGLPVVMGLSTPVFFAAGINRMQIAMPVLNGLPTPDDVQRRMSYMKGMFKK